MTTPHTPGPWTYNTTWGLIVAKDGTEIAACHSGIKANSRLIAAAPEMLEALERAEAELYRLCGDALPGITASVATDIRAAIAKATA